MKENKGYNLRSNSMRNVQEGRTNCTLIAANTRYNVKRIDAYLERASQEPTETSFK